MKERHISGKRLSQKEFKTLNWCQKNLGKKTSRIAACPSVATCPACPVPPFPRLPLTLVTSAINPFLLALGRSVGGWRLRVQFFPDDRDFPMSAHLRNVLKIVTTNQPLAYNMCIPKPTSNATCAWTSSINSTLGETLPRAELGIPTMAAKVVFHEAALSGTSLSKCAMKDSEKESS